MYILEIAKICLFYAFNVFLNITMLLLSYLLLIHIIDKLNKWLKNRKLNILYGMEPLFFVCLGWIYIFLTLLYLPNVPKVFNLHVLIPATIVLSFSISLAYILIRAFVQMIVSSKIKQSVVVQPISSAQKPQVSDAISDENLEVAQIDNVIEK